MLTDSWSGTIETAFSGADLVENPTCVQEAVAAQFSALMDVDAGFSHETVITPFQNAAVVNAGRKRESAVPETQPPLFDLQAARKKAVEKATDLDRTHPPELDMDNLFYEVKKFSVRGYSSSEKEQRKAQIAISLGAKPAKRKAVNYKALKVERQMKKARDEELRRTLDRKISKSKRKGRKWKKSRRK